MFSNTEKASLHFSKDTIMIKSAENIVVMMLKSCDCSVVHLQLYNNIVSLLLIVFKLNLNFIKGHWVHM